MIAGKTTEARVRFILTRERSSSHPGRGWFWYGIPIPSTRAGPWRAVAQMATEATQSRIVARSDPFNT